MLLTKERPFNELTYLQFAATILEPIPVQVCQKRPLKLIPSLH